MISSQPSFHTVLYSVIMTRAGGNSDRGARPARTARTRATTRASTTTNGNLGLVRPTSSDDRRRGEEMANNPVGEGPAMSLNQLAGLVPNNNPANNG